MSTRPRNLPILPAHYIHADAASGDIGHLLGGGKSGLENEA